MCLLPREDHLGSRTFDACAPSPIAHRTPRLRSGEFIGTMSKGTTYVHDGDTDGRDLFLVIVDHREKLTWLFQGFACRWSW